MAQVINTNVASLNSQRNLGTSQASLNTSLQRLSSGLRINSAKDDAAGLSISERMTSQINGLDQAKRNANDGISMSQTAEGALSSAGDMLQRVRQLAVQSANSTNSASDRQSLQNEVTQLVSELDRLSTTTEFNGKKLFDGSFGTAQFQVGANANQTISASAANLRTSNYGNNQVGSAGPGLGASTLAAAGAEASLVTAGNVDINGFIGSKTVAVAAGDSAKTIAQNVNNASNSTGVTATARTDAQLTFSAAGAYNLKIIGDNSTAETVSFTLSAASGSDGLSAAVTAFNDKSAKTGVTASLNADNTGIVLTSETGQNIRLQDTAVANAGTTQVQALKADQTTALGAAVTLAADTTADGTLVTGQVTFDSEKSFSAVQAAGGTNILGAVGAVTTNSALNKVSSLDITSFANATQALKTVDSALSLINNERAKFGAVQSRFENTISNLQSTSENLSASRSRIRDTDFASETANMTRNQVLQQAGTAMLAQANALPNQVLSLLRG
ncbi:flagellin [Jeongeupia naejangsanensis]|uniref:Flagellin n=1 Tax=Jeongeupia naejangsanensis TaxID=613195 RepID=A0ABS2BF17_9NEIS|nr:flagellin [Jeongeupia naejangsanensis]MBM3114206.1 flagellin [Jeongeupia naejangsanensis]